jgi:hypothetical protein
MRIPAAPYGYALLDGLLGARFDLGIGQGAERVVDDHRDQIAHTEGVALHLRLVQKLGGDDNRGRPAQRFQSNAVMRTARSA